MRDIADDGNDEILEIPLVLADRQEVEQALGRVRNVRLARIQDADVGIDVPGYIRRYSRARVAHDKDIDLHCLERVHHVEDALALLARRRIHVEVENVGAESLGGEVERRTGPGARLEEEIRYGATLERLAPDGAFAARAQEGLGPVQQRGEVLPIEAAQRQQMPQAAGWR